MNMTGNVDRRTDDWDLEISIVNEAIKRAARELMEAWEFGALPPETVEKLMSRYDSYPTLAPADWPTHREWLIRLKALDDIRRALPFALALTMSGCRKAGASWDEIAQMAGRSKQAVHRQYSDLVEMINEVSVEHLSDLESTLAANHR
ncbi:hypothetical protein [Streptosporangium roseum]|uniref:hypothetical protein n=1 Tax=Streptosporangium roseum TaxID=2001 RepID=UPI003319D59F